MSNSAPDSSLSSLVPRLLPLHAPTKNTGSRFRPLQLLLATCVCFSCYSLIASVSTAPLLRPLQLLLPDCVRFNCYSPIASVSTAPRLRPLQLLLPDCVRFNCSPIASTSAVAPRLRPLQLLLRLHLQLPDCVCFDCCSPILHLSAVLEAAHAQCSRTFFAEFEVRRSCVTSLVPPHEHPTSVTHTHTHRQTHG